MPPKQAVEAKGPPSDSLLRHGKYNNVVSWNLDMRTSVGEKYGMTALFLTTDKRYEPPLPRASDYTVAYPVGEAEAVSVTNALTTKMKENYFNARMKKIIQQRDDEAKIWSVMWLRMSQTSQAKVQELPEYEAANLSKDCVLLWDMIRRTHLTHVYGEGDPLQLLNVKEQENRYEALRQGEREFLSNFQVRFESQVKACVGAGVPDVTASKRAMDFVYKLDARRYGAMVSSMRNAASKLDPTAYPTTVIDAIRRANNWVNEDPGFVKPSGNTIDTHSAFVTETEPTDKPEGKSVTDKPADGEVKKKDKSGVECFVCGKMGHYARECKKKKSTGKALVAKSSDVEDYEQEEEYEEEGVVYVTSLETVLFTRNDVLLDSQASVNVFCNRDILSNVRESAKKVMLNRVQAKATGVKINQEGDFNEVGKCYFSKDATANILSYAVMVDEGNDVSYDKVNDRFILRPAKSSRVYSFCRKNISGSEGKFYCCYVLSMVKERPTKYPDSVDHVLIETVENNLLKYTKREIAGAEKARLLLGKMGYPSVRNAMDIATKGTNFDVTARDFAIAEDIYGMDMASLKGRRRKWLRL